MPVPVIILPMWTFIQPGFILEVIGIVLVLSALNGSEVLILYVVDLGVKS